jgi:transposase
MAASDAGRALSAVGVAVIPVSEAKELRARIRELERLLGRKTMEVGILKEALEGDY